MFFYINFNLDTVLNIDGCLDQFYTFLPSTRCNLSYHLIYVPWKEEALEPVNVKTRKIGSKKRPIDICIVCI